MKGWYLLGFLVLFAGLGAAQLTTILLANSIDKELAGDALSYLGERGIAITEITSDNFQAYKDKHFIVILGGPDAPEGVGTIVSGILSEEERVYLRSQKGRKNLYIKTNVWKNSQVVMVLAGFDRSDTQSVSTEKQVEVASELGAIVAVAGDFCTPTPTNLLKLIKFGPTSFVVMDSTKSKYALNEELTFKVEMEREEFNAIIDAEIEIYSPEGLEISGSAIQTHEDLIGNFEPTILTHLWTINPTGIDPTIELKVTYKVNDKDYVLCTERTLKTFEPEHTLEVDIKKFISADATAGRVELIRIDISGAPYGNLTYTKEYDGVSLEPTDGTAKVLIYNDFLDTIQLSPIKTETEVDGLHSMEIQETALGESTPIGLCTDLDDLVLALEFAYKDLVVRDTIPILVKC
ncbi:hypothetical protein ACFLQI_01710 [Candidatus Undinarchaeota archaeon]